MKNFEQIAKAMYDAYRANHIHKLADWHKLTQINRDCWTDAAKAKSLHQEILAAAPMDNQDSSSAEKELRHLHARVEELEAMLDAVGAGGVSAQRITQTADHIAQDRKKVAAQEPFGYFKAEPFGWRDCAETDEGAVALYEAPQPQADARDAGRYLDYLIRNQARVVNNLDEYEGEEGCADCGYWLEFTDSNSQTWVQIGVFKTPRDAIDAAIAAAKEMK